MAPVDKTQPAGMTNTQTSATSATQLRPRQKMLEITFHELVGFPKIGKIFTTTPDTTVRAEISARGIGVPMFVIIRELLARARMQPTIRYKDPITCATKCVVGSSGTRNKWESMGGDLTPSNISFHLLWRTSSTTFNSAPDGLVVETKCSPWENMSEEVANSTTGVPAFKTGLEHSTLVCAGLSMA